MRIFPAVAMLAQVTVLHSQVCKTAGSAGARPDQTFAVSAGPAKGAALKTTLAAATPRYEPAGAAQLTAHHSTLELVPVPVEGTEHLEA